MDATTARLIDFAAQADFSGLPAATLHEAKRRLIDTFACAVGAYEEPVSRMARTHASRYVAAAGSPAASVWGCSSPTTVEAAAFANGVMLRVEDISDMYRFKSGGHPSDVIAAVIAMGEGLHADGAAVINAVVLAYDVYCTFCEAVDVNSKGWDQPVYSVMACALGASKLLHLDREQMGNALALALVPNMALDQTRHGELSSWKGCAGANASRNGVFAALLAQDGFTGPTGVFEGKGGLYEIVGRFDWRLPATGDARTSISRTHMKCFPVCYHGQSAVWAAVDMRTRVRVQDIAEIRIETYEHAAHIMGADPSKWAPSTRETADHSLPYVVAIGLLDGEVTSASFSGVRLRDPEVARLMAMVKVDENAELSAQYPESAPCRLTVRMQSGEVVVTNIRYPKGHNMSPLSDAEVEQKFRGMFREYGSTSQCASALDGLWNFERARDVADVLKLFEKRA